VFFGSGVNNFGVMEVLDALVDLAPSPQPRVAFAEVDRTRQLAKATIQPEDGGFSGVVFKVQANMDSQPPRPHRLCARVPRASTRRA
jgi:peptide chain release factor 3